MGKGLDRGKHMKTKEELNFTLDEKKKISILEIIKHLIIYSIRVSGNSFVLI